MASIFFCHSSLDKQAIRKIARAMESRGHKAWIDEAEILVGDSLTDVIGSAIDEMDYFAVGLSTNSISSTWVQRELQIAIQREFSSGRVVVLPLLLEEVELPPFLRDKLYADFSSPDKFDESLRRLAESIERRQVKNKIRSKDARPDSGESASNPVASSELIELGNSRDAERSADSSPGGRKCPSCLSNIPNGLDKCIICGYDLEESLRESITKVDPRSQGLVDSSNFESEDDSQFPITIVDIDEDLCNRPRKDSELYLMYLRLSMTPPVEWIRAFEAAWRDTWYPMLRRAWIEGRYIVMHCVPDEVERYHISHLRSAVEIANDRYLNGIRRQIASERRDKSERESIENSIRDMKNRMGLGD